MNGITAKEIHASLMQLFMNAENVSWNRFNNFLLFNSILILSWATMVAPNNGKPSCIVLSAICFLGFVSGICWSFLGYRGRFIQKEYLGMAIKLESEELFWPDNLKEWKPATKTEALLESLHCSCVGSSRVLLIGCPLAVALLYVVLVAVTWGWSFK